MPNAAILRRLMITIIALSFLGVCAAEFSAPASAAVIADFKEPTA